MKRTKGPISPAHKVVSEDRWYHLNECMPPLYIKRVDGILVKDGIACSEAETHGINAIVLIVCFTHEGVIYESKCEVFKEDGRPIWNTDNYCYSRDNIAKTWQ